MGERMGGRVGGWVCTRPASLPAPAPRPRPRRKSPHPLPAHSPSRACPNPAVPAHQGVGAHELAVVLGPFGGEARLVGAHGLDLLAVAADDDEEADEELRANDQRHVGDRVGDGRWVEDDKLGQLFFERDGHRHRNDGDVQTKDHAIAEVDLRSEEGAGAEGERARARGRKKRARGREREKRARGCEKRARGRGERAGHRRSASPCAVCGSVPWLLAGRTHFARAGVDNGNGQTVEDVQHHRDKERLVHRQPQQHVRHRHDQVPVHMHRQHTLSGPCAGIGRCQDSGAGRRRRSATPSPAHSRVLSRAYPLFRSSSPSLAPSLVPSLAPASLVLARPLGLPYLAPHGRSSSSAHASLWNRSSAAALRSLALSSFSHARADIALSASRRLAPVVVPRPLHRRARPQPSSLSVDSVTSLTNLALESRLLF